MFHLELFLKQSVQDLDWPLEQHWHRKWKTVLVECKRVRLYFYYIARKLVHFYSQLVPIFTNISSITL